MDIKEALEEIKSRVKPYIGVMPQSTFSNTIRNIEAGIAKQSTVDDFMRLFGYERNEIQWAKKK